MYESSRCNLRPGNGISGGNFDVYGVDRTIPRAMTAFTAIAWYNAIETLVLLFIVFKKYTGLYFWSLLITTASVLPYASGAWLKQNNVSHNDLQSDIVLVIGSVIMVPGQSLVLYSRLHLISHNFTLVRFVFWMIIINAVVLCTPTAILNLGQHTAKPQAYTYGYAIMEKIQLCMFATQEIFISCVYLWEVWGILNAFPDRKTRKPMRYVIAMNILHLVLDIAVLLLEFFNLYMLQTTFKALVYSVKLKIEFAVLSRMVSVIRPHSAPISLNVTIPKIGDGAASERVSSATGCVCAHPQGNIPTEWRLSTGISAIVSPSTTDRANAYEWSPTFSLASVERMYPGRLG